MDVLKVILVVVICASKVMAWNNGTSSRPCDALYIRCGAGNTKCTHMNYICDGDNDCGDYTDEADDLCEWRQELPKRSGCESRHLYCDGSCVPISSYCNCTDIPLDPRVCQMFRDGYLQRLDHVTLPTLPSTTIPTPTPSGLEKSETLGEIMQDKLKATLVHESCPPLYTLSNGHCLSFFFLVKLSWAESRSFCHAIGGDLIKVKDETHLRGLVTQLRALQDSDIKADYWLGGNLKNVSVGWQWLDDTLVPLGTPFWTIRNDPHCWLNETSDNDTSCYTQAPHEPPVGRCLALTHNKFYYFSDEKCLDKKSPLCIYDKDIEVRPPQYVQEPHLQNVEEPHHLELQEPDLQNVQEIHPQEVQELHLQNVQEFHPLEVQDPYIQEEEKAF